ncbi:putative cleavage and polyadenylation specificity factor subunit 4-like protein [Aquarana catesbeiana]|uniref:putative cleavage and polyadenylation specificity factor subunit 4-like protein n=1 Tax=Aquarana catesbeiana TaxID=8400 RepID=UPI003CC926E3
MQDIIAGFEKFNFDLEKDVDGQRGSFVLPFQGMDKSGAAVCIFFIRGLCRKGAMCPFRHLTGEKTVVCKHWLRGLCKKGDQCEFLHEYDMDRMPECYFYSKFGECSNKDCPFLHIDPASKIKDCPWYDRGFCKHESFYVLVEDLAVCLPKNIGLIYDGRDFLMMDGALW